MPVFFILYNIFFKDVIMDILIMVFLIVYPVQTSVINVLVNLLIVYLAMEQIESQGQILIIIVCINYLIYNDFSCLEGYFDNNLVNCILCSP